LSWSFPAGAGAARGVVREGVSPNNRQSSNDLSGNLTNLIDGKGQNTFWKFDEFSRVTNKTEAAGNVMGSVLTIDNQATTCPATSRTSSTARGRTRFGSSSMNSAA